MAVLSNGLNTLDLGAFSWSALFNSDVASLYTYVELEGLLTNKALLTHNHDSTYMDIAYTIVIGDVQAISASRTLDITVNDGTKGITVFDTVTVVDSRIYLDNGVLTVEVVV